MTRFTDGTKTISIEMKVWNGNGYNPSLEADFFGVSGLTYNTDADAYEVEDVSYIADMAAYWSNGTLPLSMEDEPTTEEIENRFAMVEEVF